jgi:hypothetical protein
MTTTMIMTITASAVGRGCGPLGTRARGESQTKRSGRRRKDATTMSHFHTNFNQELDKTPRSHGSLSPHVALIIDSRAIHPSSILNFSSRIRVLVLDPFPCPAHLWSNCCILSRARSICLRCRPRAVHARHVRRKWLRWCDSTQPFGHLIRTRTHRANAVVTNRHTGGPSTHVHAYESAHPPSSHLHIGFCVQFATPSNFDGGT